MEQSYKEKYEDILARLERAKNDNEVCDERFCCVIDDLIPELAESEDEKVRKELTKHLKELSDWKEDEVIPVKNPSCYRQWATWLEKQGEKKPEENKGNIGGISSNSEWSKEDEEMLKQVEVSLSMAENCYCSDEFKEKVSIQRNWLKSLRPQNHWKPSETDIMILEKVFNGKIDPKDFQATLFNVLEQLKKL